MRLLIPLWASLALAAPATPQQTPTDTSDLPTIQVDVNVVNVLCTVRDKNHRLVADLTKDDFDLREDGVEQKIKYFARETNLPLTLGLLVDVSGSQEALIGVEKEASYRFFSDVLRPKDLAFLMSFGTEVELLQDLTSSKSILHDGLDQLRLNAAVGGVLTPGTIPTANPKGTVLWDAVFLAADERLKHEVGRKAIVVITDGVDMGSTVTKRRAIEAAQKADVMIYCIYYADPRYQQGFGGGGYGDLKDLSDETGGGVFRVTRRDTLEVIYDQIQEEMRNQYALGYTPTNAEKDGSYRKLKIEVNRKGVKVQARNGYYAIRRQ